MRSERSGTPWVTAVTVVAVAALLATTAGAAEAAKRIAVTATDTGFKLSIRAAPEGAVTFTVTNRGKRKHNFRIAGRKTPVLAPGQRRSLTVTFTKAGLFPYVSTVPGDAATGLRGAFTVKPAKTVKVTATDKGFKLSASAAPLGSVGFVVKNAGARKHNFRIAGAKTPILLPRKTATLIVNFKRAGKYRYVSTVAGDAARGLKGTFAVEAKATTPPPGEGTNLAAGKQVFATTGCGSCHTLKAAGTSGTVGPNLDASTISRATVVARVTSGKGTMPPYAGTLSPQQIQDVADFIVGSRTG
jgi:mono/diheme cytochrome c family protein